MNETERQILTRYRTVAVVGASPDPERHSNAVMAYLLDAGYRVYAVNPMVEEVLGLKSYPNLKSVPEAIDIVDVFRAPDKVMPLVDDAVAVGAKVLWLQEGVINEAAAEKARRAGLTVVMNRCIAKAYAELIKEGPKHNNNLT